jgi:hypothetical protein
VAVLVVAVAVTKVLLVLRELLDKELLVVLVKALDNIELVVVAELH